MVILNTPKQAAGGNYVLRLKDWTDALHHTGGNTRMLMLLHGKKAECAELSEGSSG